jgi:hypothetical protein
MKIAIINGSQKTGESNTGIILEKLNTLFETRHEIVNYKLGIKKLSSEELKDITFFDFLFSMIPFHQIC